MADVAPELDPRPDEEWHWRSKVDLLLVAALGVGLIGCLALAGWVFATDRARILSALGIALSGTLPLGLFLPIRYTLDRQLLRIRSGLFRWRIPLPLILEVRPARRGVGPALSFDRLAVTFRTPEGSDRVIISPRGRDEFLRVLRDVAPQVVIAGGDGA